MKKTVELLEKVEDLRENEMYYVSREDGQTIGVTKDKSKIEQMIQDENPDTEVTLTNIIFIKSNYTYEVVADILEDGEEEADEHEFTLGTVIIY